MNRLDSLDFDALLLSVTEGAARLLWGCVAVSVTASVLLIVLPDLATIAGGILLWGMILLALCGAITGWEKSVTGYALVGSAFALQSLLPPALAAIMGEHATASATAFVQAAGFPMVIGVLLVFKDLFLRIKTGLSLKRVQTETGVVLYAANLVDEAEADAMRQFHKYRLLVGPTILASVIVYLILLQPIQGAVVGSLKRMETLVVQPVSPGQSGKAMQASFAAIPSAALTAQMTAETRSTVHRAAIELSSPVFINFLLAAFGMMFVTQMLSLLEWAIYVRHW